MTISASKNLHMIIQTNVMTFKIMKPFIYSPICYDFRFTYKESEQMSKYCSAKRKLGHILINTLRAVCSVSFELIIFSLKQLFKIHSRIRSWTKHSQDQKKILCFSVTHSIVWRWYHDRSFIAINKWIIAKLLLKHWGGEGNEREAPFYCKEKGFL